MIANGMDENRIEVEDVMFAAAEAIKTQIEPLVRQNQPQLLQAAWPDTSAAVLHQDIARSQQGGCMYLDDNCLYS